MKNFMDDLREMVSQKGKENIDYPNFIMNNILHDGDKLIFLTKTGSHLYGMNTPKSDLDLKGLFLPSQYSLILENQADQYGCFSTKVNNNNKNTSDDIDIELWSLQKFFKLLQKGDTNAYDILFASSNNNAVLFTTDTMKDIYSQRSKLIGIKPILNSFIGYAYGQYKRYESKGFNFQTLKYILTWFKYCDCEPNNALREYAEYLIKDFNPKLLDNYDNPQKQIKKQLRIISDKKDEYLLINEYKQYPLGIRVKQFIEQIQQWVDQYGNRVKNNDEGIDYKSLSHAYRVLDFANKLALTADLVFPLQELKIKHFLKMKNGEYDYMQLVNDLDICIDVISDELRDSEVLNTKPNAKLMKQIILNTYIPEGDLKLK